MRFVQAILALGLFGYFGFEVLSGGMIDDGAGSRKGMALRSAINAASEKFGTTETGLGLIAIGILLAMFFVGRRGQEET